MTSPVFVLPDEVGQVVVGQVVSVTGQEAHHAVAVRRLQVGEPVELVDGQGLRVQGVVDFPAGGASSTAGSAGRAAAVSPVLPVRVVAVWQEPAPGWRVSVVQALPKAERAELAVQMLTEVGVDEVVPWTASRCVARWEGARGQRSWQRWQSNAREAGKQSRRARFPLVSALASTKQVQQLLLQAQLALVLHEQAQISLLAQLEDFASQWRQPDTQPDPSGQVVLVVGPEGGLSEAELHQFAAAGATAVRLGPTVLRTSTAGTVAAGLVLSKLRWQ